MALAVRSFAINLSSSQLPSTHCSITAFVSSHHPAASLSPNNFIMSSKRNGSSSSDKSSSKKKARQQSLTGFFASSKSKSSDNDDNETSSSFKYKIFCDLDGVLVDFESGVKSLFNGRSPDDLHPGTMWGRISSTPNFYANLPWTADGQVLWRELVQLPSPPDILTGVPRNFPSRAEKFAWCQRELSAFIGTNDNSDDGNHCVAKSWTLNHVDMAGKKNNHEVVSGRKKRNGKTINVITCWSRNKHCESRTNHVLIDDRIALRDAWEENGGVFVHHTSAKRTIEILRKRGILLESGDE